jgi:hypothetical protein
VCPVCAVEVASASASCRSCHLPMRDVRANQPTPRGARSSDVARNVSRRLLGAVFYVGLGAWFAYRLPGTVTFLVPGVVIALWLHVVKGRSILGALAFVMIVGVLPTLFWPSMWTDLGNDVSAWFR